MQINEKLNLVVPMRGDGSGAAVHAYHTPISREVFESNFLILAATKSALSSRGSHFLIDSGPRIAALTLRDECRKDAAARGAFDEKGQGVDYAASALLAELKRLTMVLCPSAKGWDMLPVDTAVQRGVIDADDWAEVESALVFFTCHYALAKKSDRQDIAQGTASLLRGESTSLSPMDYVASLPTSTPDEPTPVVTSSVPS